MPGEMETERDLEGPFLTLAEFMRAQEIRERLQRRKKAVASSQSENEDIKGTFELTATAHEEAELQERPISRASDELSFTSKSNASLASKSNASLATTQYGNQKKLSHKMIQTVPATADEDPEMILRRYYFRVDWSKRSPTVDSACKCTDIFQNFREGLSEVVSRRRAAAAALAESSSNPDAKKLEPLDAHWAEAGKHKKKPKLEAINPNDDSTSKSEKAINKTTEKFHKHKDHLYNEVPTGSLCYYEVKLNKDQVNPVYDYTVDYRRFSYADFKVADVVGNSTILPELLAIWLSKAEPRNQDDVFPLLVLCKDLLQKFCLRETRYAFKREEYLEKQIVLLQQSWDETLAEKAREKEQFDQINLRQIQELKETHESLASAQAELLEAKKQIEGLELGKKMLLGLISELQPQCEAQVRELEEQLSCIRSLEQVVGIMDSAFRDIKHEAQVGQTGAQAHVDMLEREVVRLNVRNGVANERIALLEEALRTSNSLNDEFMGHFNALMSRKPEEVLGSMPFEQRMQFLRVLIRDPENLIMHVEEQDLSALSVHCLRFASCLFLGGIRSKSSNYGAWIETISESFGCSPDNLVYSILTAMKADGRHVTLSSASTTSVLWHFVAKEMSIADVNLDLGSFDRIDGGGSNLILKIISEDDGAEESDVASPTSLAEGEEGTLHTGDDDRVTPTEMPGSGGGAVKYVYKSVEVRKEEEYIVKKYGLFNMKVVKTVESYSIEDTMATIGAIIDFKAESDYRCDMSIRPRSNLVKAIRLYMTQRCKHFEDTELELKRLCKSIMTYRGNYGLAKVFGTVAGMTETRHWSERSICFLLELIKSVKELDEPGEESKDPDTLAEGWQVYRTWIRNWEKSVDKQHFLQGLEAACEGMFGFGAMSTSEIEKALQRCATPAPPKSKRGAGQRIQLHPAIDAVMTLWFHQLDDSRERLKALFVKNDVNGDGVLEMDEFIHLIKSTGYKMRQHDAMNMFHELAGPDDTVDQDEFSELVVFMKFNVRAILGEKPE